MMIHLFNIFILIISCFVFDKSFSLKNVVPTYRTYSTKLNSLKDIWGSSTKKLISKDLNKNDKDSHALNFAEEAELKPESQRLGSKGGFLFKKLRSRESTNSFISSTNNIAEQAEVKKKPIDISSLSNHPDPDSPDFVNKIKEIGSFYENKFGLKNNQDAEKKEKKEKKLNSKSPIKKANKPEDKQIISSAGISLEDDSGKFKGFGAPELIETLELPSSKKLLSSRKNSVQIKKDNNKISSNIIDEDGEDYESSEYNENGSFTYKKGSSEFTFEGFDPSELSLNTNKDSQISKSNSNPNMNKASSSQSNVTPTDNSRTSRSNNKPSYQYTKFDSDFSLKNNRDTNIEKNDENNLKKIEERRNKVLLQQDMLTVQKSSAIKQEEPFYRLRKPSADSITSTKESIKQNKGDYEKSGNRKSTGKYSKSEPFVKEPKIADKELYRSTFSPFNFPKSIKMNGNIESNDNLFSSHSFEDLGINNSIVLNNLNNMGIFSPTKVQEMSLHKSDFGLSLVLQSQTGTGKTLAFLLPLLKFLDENTDKAQAVILAPSRELVMQIQKSAEMIFNGTNIKSVGLIGGANIHNQIKQIRDIRPQILIATPGRLAELTFGERKVKLNNIRAVILDEADNLLTSIFKDEIKSIIEATPLISNRRQLTKRNLHKEENYNSSHISSTLNITDSMHSFLTTPENSFFNLSHEIPENASYVNETKSSCMLCLASATVRGKPEVVSFMKDYSPGKWSTADASFTGLMPKTITHGVISCPPVKTFDTLRKVLHSTPKVERALIFVNNPNRVNELCEKLFHFNIVAAPLHGSASKDDRKEILSRIRDGRLKYVVTTELASRGLDIPDLSHVINYELPTDSQHYVHRVGRCGRLGKPGLAISIAGPSTKFVLKRFGKQLKAHIMDCEIRESQIFLRPTVSIKSNN